MFTEHDILFFYAESPVHAGTGVGLGAVDMPIQRERATGYPMIQSSGVKGVLRRLGEESSGLDNEIVSRIFGKEDNAGAISPGDARILLFPVRALKGVFVWITCPDVLARFKVDIGSVGIMDLPDIPKVGEDFEALCSSSTLLIGNQIMLEEFSYDARQDDGVTGWANWLAQEAMPQDDSYSYYRDRIQSHLILLKDEEFRDYVMYSTEIVTRIKLNQVTKTVEQGALFTQELLPRETILYSPIHITSERTNDDKSLSDREIKSQLRSLRLHTQIGGDETIGRGLVRLNWLGV